MRISTVGALCLSLCIPSVAAAEDVMVALTGTQVPVGPTGTVVFNVERTRVGTEDFAVIRARATEQTTPCGVAPERVAVWGFLEGHWVEMAHEIFDRCLIAPTGSGHRNSAAVRARIIDVVESGRHFAEFHVRIIDPRLPLEQSSLVRYHRVGDRFAAQRVTEPLAPTPGLVSSRVLAALTDAHTDGQLTEWSTSLPIATSEHGSLWMAQSGDRLLVAGDLLTGEGAAPTVTVSLADVGTGTGQMRSQDGNHGRTVQLSCGEAQGAAVRCARVGGRWHLEGSIDLSAQIYHQRTIDAVAMLAVAEAGGHRLLTTHPGLRLEGMRFAAPIDLLHGASREVMARCVGGFVGRVASGAASDDELQGALVTCGPLCSHGQCEQTMGTGEVAGRLEFSNGGSCIRGMGPGAAEVDGCLQGAHSRLVGSTQVQGFDAVLGVERSWSVDGTQWHQGEIWMLVTASAGWRRLTIGAAQQGAPAMYSRVSVLDGHPALCTASGTCEVLHELALQRRESVTGNVTGDVIATLRQAGLVAHGEAQ